MTMTDELASNVEWFRTNRDRLLADSLTRGKFVVVHDREIKGRFDTFATALRDAAARLPLGEFAIQQVIEPSTTTVDLLRSAI